jgi:hypothetical protein
VRHRAGLSALALALVILLPTPTADAAAPRLSVRDVRAGESTSPQAKFVVKLSRASRRSVTVRFATRDGTATSPADYSRRTGRVRFKPGQRRRVVSVPVKSDQLQEGPEKFSLRLRKPAGARVGDGTGVATIVDDDPVPGIFAGDATVTEGSAALVPITLANPTTKSVTVSFATGDGTATAGTDYTAASGTLTFAPGDTTESVTFPTAGNGLDQSDRSLSVTLSGPSNGVIIDGTASVTIIDDDPIAISVSSDSVDEASAGSIIAQFDVTLSAPSTQTISVNYTTTDGSAVAPADYSPAFGTLTFVPGDMVETIPVEVIDDGDYESTEGFTMDLTGPVNASISDGSGAGTITDDESVCIAQDGPATASFMGNIRGDTNNDFAQQLSAIDPCNDIDWYLFTLQENSGAGAALTAIVTMSSTAKPSGHDNLTLCAHNSDGSMSACSTLAAGQTETVCITKPDTVNDDTRNVVVNVFGVGGVAVNDYDLQVMGNMILPGGCPTLTLG